MLKSEIVNAARSYERIIAQRRNIFIESLKLNRKGKIYKSRIKANEYYESKKSAREAERLLAKTINLVDDFVRIDNVIYMKYSDETLLRIPLDDIPDLAKEES